MPGPQTSAGKIHRVGTLYQEGRHKWPEVAEYTWSDSGPQLVLFFNRPRRQELESISSGAAEFALAIEDDVLFLLCRFQPGIPWGAAPYAPSLKPNALSSLPESRPGQRTFLQVLLVDAATGVLSTLRMVSLNVEFSSLLISYLQPQNSSSWDAADFRRRLLSIHTRIADPEALLVHAVAQFHGGD